MASPAASLRQPLVLLLLGAVPVDGEHRQRALHRHEAAEPAVAGFQFQAGQAVADGVGARTSVAVQVHAEQAEVAELLGQFLWQRGRFEPVFDVGPKSGVDELAHGGGDVAFVVVEQPVGVEQFQRCVGGLLAGGGAVGDGHGGLLR